MSTRDDEQSALQRRITVARMLGLQTAQPARSCFVTRLDQRVYVGLRGAGYVRLRAVDARVLATALNELAEAIEHDRGEHHHP